MTHLPIRPCLTSWTIAALAATAVLGMAPRADAQTAAGNVERGRYLVTITGCHDCHSPKVQGMTPDLTRSLSGRPATTPLPSDTTTEVHASLDLTAWKGPWGSSGRTTPSSP